MDQGPAPQVGSEAAHAVNLDAVRRRRAELQESIQELEHCLAAPAASSAVVWGEHLHSAVQRLAADFADHIAVTEGDGGLHDTIREQAPRLHHAVQMLTADHGELASRIAAVLAATEPPVVPEDVEPVAADAAALIARLVRHRRRGADLIFEAFETDLGVGD